MAFPTSGCTTYYKLENVNDSVGSLNFTNHGTVTFVAGKIANCANFVAASVQWLSHADAAAYHFGTGDFSFEYWFNTSVNANFQQLFNYGGRGVNGSFYMELNGDSLGGTITDVSGNTLNLSLGFFAVLNDGNWHQVIVTVARAGNYKVIVDNVTKTNASAAALTGSVNSTSLGLGLGADESGANEYTGKIDEVGMWNRALTGTETSDLWNAGAGITFPVSTQSQRRTLSALGTRIGSRQLQEV